MKKKDNVIYIDFVFKRKRINSRFVKAIYKYVHMILKVSDIIPRNTTSKNDALDTNRQTSNY